MPQQAGKRLLFGCSFLTYLYYPTFYPLNVIIFSFFFWFFIDVLVSLCWLLIRVCAGGRLNNVSLPTLLNSLLSQLPLYVPYRQILQRILSLWSCFCKLHKNIHKKRRNQWILGILWIILLSYFFLIFFTNPLFWNVDCR